MKDKLKAVGMGLVVSTGIIVHMEIQTFWSVVFVLFPAMFLLFELTNFYLENKQS